MSADSSDGSAAPAPASAPAGKAAALEGAITCPYCGDSVPVLVPIDTGMRLGLKEAAQIASVPDSVCAGCHSLLSRMISKGSVLRAQAKAKEQNKIQLWRNRVGLVKKAKEVLSQKNYSDAAVHYEKYIRILEIIYDKKSGELTPEVFSGGGRAQELTVIASTYWDLMRIYDTTPRFKDRQMKAAEKLAEFVRFTPVFAAILRKAESQARIAKNPDAFKHFIRRANQHRPRCFIATSAFADDESPQAARALFSLRQLRDRVLRRRALGRKVIVIYYRNSPAVARWMDRHPSTKPPMRWILSAIARITDTY